MTRGPARPSRAERRRLQTALEVLGSGVLAHRAQAATASALAEDDPGAAAGREALRHGLHRGLLRVVLRLLVRADLVRGGVLPPGPGPGGAPASWAEARAEAGRLAVGRGGAPHLGGVFRTDPDGDALAGVRLPAGAWTAAATTLAGLGGTEHGPDDAGDWPALAYEWLLELEPQVHVPASGPPQWRLVRSRDARRASGSWWTPPDVVALVLDEALDPVLEQAVRAPEPTAALLDLRVLDPAVGAGDFLLAAGHRVVARLGDLGVPARTAWSQVARGCLVGVDRDPLAADLAQARLWHAVARAGAQPACLDDRLVVGDSLVGTTPDLLAAGLPDLALTATDGDDRADLADRRRTNARERTAAATPCVPTRRRPRAARDAADAWCLAFLDRPAPVTDAGVRALAAGTDPEAAARVRGAAARHRPVHWHLDLPDLAARGGADVVVGNPPFLSPLRAGALVSRRRSLVRHVHGGLGGPKADESTYFLLLAARLRRPGGRVGLVLPDSVLASADAADVRRGVAARHAVAALWRGDGSEFGAAVTPVALVLADPDPDPDPGAAVPRLLEGRPATPLPDRPRRVLAEAWASGRWSLLAARRLGALLERPSAPHDLTVGDLADVAADYRDQYYGLRGAVVEARPDDHDPRPRLVTTGAVDPWRLRWGEVESRFDGARYRRPVVDLDRLDARMQRWAARRLVPKLLVATQGRTLEIVLDRDGTLLPCVPVISVVPTGGLGLEQLGALLGSPAVHDLLVARTLGSGLGAHSLKVSATDVRAVPAPAGAAAAADLGAAGLLLGALASDARARARFAMLTDAACGLDPQDSRPWESALLATVRDQEA
ncbi:Eco57I restriction-modification methylase domain-containing protein [Nocardioides bruguierae]|uniref:Eco57I restriction-modification methylase domain-containing protein n=1 Tax=Nocardioides bruguierae TaxID=2945102 RepID=UPI00202229AB|nr:hypothetical protein [Nocardioides bruguierae]MCL8025986.1 hypothetical protein [Nocardioides bruguierae]